MISILQLRALRLAAFILLGVVSNIHAALPASRWIWKDGSDLGNQPGTYATPGIPNAQATPGSRQGAATWEDGSGNLWLFGGYGYDKNGTLGYLADLWKYTPSTGQWTFMLGADQVNTPGLYSSPGTASNGRPGARYRVISWTDSAGRFWIFGGAGYAGSGAAGGLNDLWMYDPNAGGGAANKWTWMGGSPTRNHPGNYGPLGAPSSTYLPPNRAGGVGWADASGNLWLFGGLQTGTDGTTTSKLNDLWRYDIENRRWTFMKGTTAPNARGEYGFQGSGNSATRPGSRFLAQAWTDGTGKFWLLGGHGYATSTSVSGFLQDLWRYDPMTDTWTWINGSNGLDQNAKHGSVLVPSHSNTPGGITEGLAWTDPVGDLWLYGGAGYPESGAVGELSALWRYRISTNEWTWMNGLNSTGEAPVYGSLGSPSPTNANTPGGLHAAAVWVAAGRAWLFGGEKYDPTLGSTFSQTVWQLAEPYSQTITSGQTSVAAASSVLIGNSIVGAGVSRTFTITNTGLSALTGLNVVVTNAHHGFFTLTTPPATSLAPGASTDFVITFTADSPTATNGAGATIVVDSADLDPVAFTAIGTGISPSVYLSVGQDWVWEDDDTALVALTFTRTGGTAAPLTVNFTVSGNATFDTDYFASNADTFTATGGTVTIPAGASSATIEIIPLADTDAEPEEFVQINLVATPPYTLGFPNVLTATIASEEAVIGTRDRHFYPEITGTTILASALQGDGKLLIGGGLSAVNGVASSYLARLLPDGSVDLDFSSSLTGAVTGLLVQGDGGIVVAGGTHGLNRLLADGSLDPDFVVPGTFTFIDGLAQQPDGKLLIGGNFVEYGGAARNHVARLHPDGTLDTTFDPGLGANDHVGAIAVQPDGKILIAGNFTQVAGQPRHGIARLNIDGTLDATFNPGTGADGAAPNDVLALLVQPDGRIVIAGAFATFNDQPRNCLARLLSDGSLDPDFSATAGTDQYIYALALQTDGKIFLGGYFATFDGQPSPNLARLNSDGTLDTTFQVAAGPSNGIVSLTLLPDGQLLAGGNASVVDELHSLLSRRFNGPATHTLAPASGSVAQWLRSGTGPEFTAVTFDLSTDSGAHWTPLGPGTRIVGGWEIAGAALPVSGQLRARGTTSGGYFSATSSLIEQVQAFTRAPEIAVESPTGAALVDDVSSYDFGPKVFPPPSSGPAPTLSYFIIRNIGNADLSYPTLSVDGANAGDFFFNGPFTFPTPTSIPPGGTRAFAYTFTPQALGARSATLHIASNDADEASFDIAFTGVGASAAEVWRHTHFGTLTNTGNAADDADPDGDGTSNLLERYAGLNPNDPTARFQVRIEPVAGEPNQRKILFTGLPFTFINGSLTPPQVLIKYRTSLTSGDWQTLDNGQPINWAFPEWWTLDTDAGPGKFYRVEITPP